MRYSVLAIFASATLWFGCLFLGANAYGTQLDTPLNKVLNRVRQEREKVYSYYLSLDFEGQIPNSSELLSVATDESSKGTLDLEYRRVGETYISGLYIGNGSNRKFAGLIGRSRDVSLRSSGRKLYVSKVDLNHFSRFRKVSELLVFDPRATGMLSSESLKLGFKYESLVTEIAGMENKYVTAEDGDLMGFRWPDIGREIWFDTRKGYWPVRSLCVNADGNEKETWNVEVGSFEGHHLPIRATFQTIKTDGRKDTTESLKLRYTWRTINQVFPSGIDAAQRWSEKLKIDIDIE